jgi:hypothetical protein
MKRFHKIIFRSKEAPAVDKLVHKLILAKKDDPKWVLTSEVSRKMVARGEPVLDFTKTPEWCDPFIYSASLKTLLKVGEEETPHIKAIYIDEAVTQAIHAM